MGLQPAAGPAFCRPQMHPMPEQTAGSPAAAASLSVVLPAYNVAPWLESCVASLLHDAPQQLEIIVVDDGSPDDTPRLADALAAADRRVRVIHQANAGCPAARNAGLEAAHGTYVGFVDPDDEVEPGWARHLLEAAAIGVPAAIVKGEFRTVDQHGTAGPVSHECMDMVRYSALHWFGSMWSAIYRRDFLLRYGLRFPRQFYDDIDFQVRALVTALLEHEPIGVNPRAVYRYQHREGSLDGSEYSSRQIAGVLSTTAQLHELLRAHARQLPPSGVTMQYLHYIKNLAGVCRKAREPQDRTWAAVLFACLHRECPYPDALQRLLAANGTRQEARSPSGTARDCQGQN